MENKSIVTGEHGKKALEEASKTKLQRLEEQAKEYSEKYGQMEFTIITSRPEGMPYELYKFLRKSSNRAIKEYLSRGNV